MCGICGVVGIERPERAQPIVRQMTAAMHHRGPDAEGFFVAPGAALGMRRLSIIDLAGGHQPVFNESGDIAVVFNGEIYNFAELRQLLQAQGHAFRTRSDTEVIVHAYESWAEDCVAHLRGMFAFAVLDLRGTASGHGPRLLLARDRLGIKPLYYSWADGVLLFASEVRALLASQWLAPQLSPGALEAYLLFGSVSEPTTLIENLFSLPPGHRMTIELAPASPDGSNRRATPRLDSYWKLGEVARGAPEPSPANLPAAARQLRPVLEDAVRSHLVADVPLGVFLSSGLDSTAVVALASRQQPGVHTFTVAFAEEAFDERRLARQTAERFRTQHRELVLSGEQILARLDEALAALDQPTMDGINTYFVSWAAQQVGLKVALSGLGGDELFGGYRTFVSTPRARRAAALGHRLPRALKQAVATAVATLGASSGYADRARKMAALWSDSNLLPHPYFFTRALFTPVQVAALLAPGVAIARDGDEAEGRAAWRAWLEDTARQAESLDDLTAVTCLEMRTYMINTLLRDTDAVSMNRSLEVRVPLLDHRLVEFVARLPASAKGNSSRPKALLAEALQDLLPEEVVRQRKRTFTFPWEDWLRGALRTRVDAGLSELAPALQPLLNAEAVSTIWRGFLAGRTSWSRPWSLYVLNDWVRRNLGEVSTRTEAGRPVLAVECPS